MELLKRSEEERLKLILYHARRELDKVWPKDNVPNGILDYAKIRRWARWVEKFEKILYPIE